MQCQSKQCLTDMKSHCDMIWVVISSKRHSLRQMGKCENIISSYSFSLQVTPVPIPIPVKLAQRRHSHGIPVVHVGPMGIPNTGSSLLYTSLYFDISHVFPNPTLLTVPSCS